MGEAIYKDVLVIGGGVAGMTAAIEASDRGLDVLLVTEGIAGKSGTSCLASSLSYALPFVPPDNVKLPLQDFVMGENYYLINQEIAMAVLRDAQDIGRWLEKIGVLWKRLPNGSLYQASRKSVEKATIYSTMKGETGKHISDALRDEILHREVDLREETVATSLLTKNGKVVGATALDYVNGKFVIIGAKSTILATGSGSNLWTYSTMPREQTPDGLAMAYRIGAELIGIELNRWNLCGIKWPKSWGAIGCSVGALEHVTPISPKWYDSKGQRIKLTGYHAARVMSVYKQTHTLYKGIYCSFRDVNPKLLEDCWYNFRYLKKLGIDVTKDLIECRTLAHTMSGGVRVNIRTQTTMPGLYAAGGIAGIYIADTGLINAMCLGRWSAKYASKRVQKIEKVTLDWQQIKREKKRVFDFLTKKVGSDALTPAQIKKRIRKITWDKMHFIKNEEKMKAALNELRKIRKEAVPKMQLATHVRRFNYGWVEALQVINMLDICQLIIKASLLRKESRGMFQREDYPAIDNKNWLKNIIIKLEKGKPQIYTVPVKLTYFKLEDDKRSPKEKSNYIPCVWRE